MRPNALPSLALLSLLCVAALAAPVSAWYPKSVQLEMTSATWCSSCPVAYAGVEANKAKFDRYEFNVVRYYDSTSGGQFGCAASTARIAYYSAFGHPELHFNGTTSTHRVTNLTAAGKPYEALIASLIDDPGHFRVTVNAVDFGVPTGEIDLDIQVRENLADISTLRLRMFITEGNLAYSSLTLHDVVRGAIPDVDITVDEFGEIQNVVRTFAVDPSWVTENLAVVALIQDDADKSVLASASTRVPENPSFRFYALGDKFEIGPTTDEYYFEWFRTYNTSPAPQMFTFSVTIDAPIDWTTTICGPGICYGPVYQTLLLPGQFAELKVEAIAPSSGAGVITLNIATDAHPDPEGRSIRYTYVTDDVHVLVVDDDGLKDDELYYTAALDHYGIDYAVLNTVYTTPTAELLGQFDILIWVQGRQAPTLTAGDRAALTTYLSGGGNLFLSGQDIGWELSHINQYGWMQTVLRTFFFNEPYPPDFTLSGVNGNQISDGIPLTITGGDGADNQESPNELYPADAASVGIWSYAPDQWGAVAVDTGVYKVVYFGFGFEAIDNARDRNLVMHRILNWFQGIAAADGPPRFREALSVFPNPVRDRAAVRFTLPADEQATVELFGLDGRRVRTLASGSLSAGSHVLAWDRADDAGRAMPAGLYYCRVSGERTQLQQKVVLLK